MDDFNNNTQIIALGVNCASGNRAFAMFGAVASNMSFSKPDTLMQVPSINNDSFEMAVTCPIENLDFCDDPNDRILVNTILALENAIDCCEFTHETDNIQNSKCLIYIITPETNHGRGEELDFEEWRKILLSNDLLLTEYFNIENIEIRFISYGSGVTSQLAHICNLLSQGEWDIVFFGGVDSLVDDYTSYEYSQQSRVRTKENAEGIVTGEGAAFIVLQTENSKLSLENNKSPIALIQACSQKEEQHAGKIISCRYSGQITAIKDVVEQCERHVDDIDSLIVSAGIERHFMLEWHQTQTTVWPNILPEQQRVAKQLGEVEHAALIPRKYPEKLDLSFTYGYVGAASIPMSIVLACARFKFNYPKIRNCVVCETNDFLHRGAIMLLASDDVTARRANF